MPQALTPSPRIRRMWAFRLVGPIGAVALVAAAMLLFAGSLPQRDPTRIVGLTVTVALAIAWAAVFAWLTARQEDEYVQSGAKFAWYWGGIFGIAASTPVCIFVACGGLSMFGPTHAAPDPGHSMFFTLGYLLAIASQMVGYLVVRACWPRR